MGFLELISETEAAAYAGVSPRTLRRFVDSGYLKIEHDGDGVELFDREEVGRLFGVTGAGNAGKTMTVPGIQREKVIDLKLASAVGLRAAMVPTAPSPEVAPRGEACDLLRGEVEKLKHILDVQEHLLQERERELNQVMSERDWLRKRIERLEEKSERDQILLLSETQTVRKLVNAQVERRGPVKVMLEWLGFSENSRLPTVRR